MTTRPLPKCIPHGLFGRTNHVFEARYHTKAPSLEVVSNITGSLVMDDDFKLEALKEMVTRVYVGDVCVHCGATLNQMTRESCDTL